MSIQFSGLGSGLPIDDWIKALVKIQQDKIDVLSNQHKALETKGNTFSSISSAYNAVNKSATKLTDSLLGPSSDIFSSITLKSSEDGSDKKAVTGTVTNLSTPSEFDIEVHNLATKSKFQTGQNDIWKNPKAKLSELGITAESTIKINDAEITVKPDMTVDELVYKIGNSPESGVNAYLKGGSLVLENKEFGANPIKVEGSAAGSLGFSAADAVNTDGLDAHFTINGEAKTSKSNKIGSETTGIVGLSIELHDTTKTPVTLKLSREYSADSVKTALKDFISAYNKAIAETDKATAVDGDLKGENQLTYFRNSIRTLISEASGSGKFKTLSDIGISTGAPGLDVSANTAQLVFDEKKFDEAFSADPESVKALLVGDQSKGTKGIMQNIQKALEPALDSVDGYFKARSESIGKEISTMTEKINRKNSELASYQATLQKQYTAMDLKIAKLNQQFDQMKQQLATLFPTK